MSDPYKVLGLSQNATDEEVTAAYRKLAKKYHPDVNPGDKSAEERMKEINAAYDSIKSGAWKREQTQSQYGSSYSQYDPWGFGYGYGYQQAEQNDPFRSVEVYVNAGHYREALTVLKNFSTRTAKWFYYSAIANAGLNNNVEALSHARQAVSMEPHNQQYLSLLRTLESGGADYWQRRVNYSTPRSVGQIGLSRIIWGICIFRMLCRLFGGGFCW